MSEDPFDLARFLKAQASTYREALAEIRSGHKRSHWMWFIFPQFTGLGHSPMAQLYAIGSIAEARAYLADPVLGAHYRECVASLQALPATTAERVFGGIDAMKLKSSLTLFDQAGPEPLFSEAIDRWFDGQRDNATLGLLGK
jgi:uncharacterized protein (DUF1810 family)